MDRYRTLVAIGAILMGSWALAETELEFETAYVVDGMEGLQPSGLALCNGKLLFVSDKHQEHIFELVLTEEGIAQVKPSITLNDVPAPPKQAFAFDIQVKRFFKELLGIGGTADWEGIACNQQGEIFLASEYFFSVLKVSPNGDVQWIVEDLYRVGNTAGLFQKENAYLEGITLYNGGLILAAERDPRGLITISGNGDIDVLVQPGSQLPEDEQRPYDFTGLEVYRDKLFALERNHYRVCERNPPQFISSRCYSFKTYALSGEWGYSDNQYGLAEGLAIEEKSIWIIIDNNGDARLSDPDDHRSTLMKFKNPIEN